MINNLVFNPNAIVEVTKDFTFDSAHFLKEYTGKCSSMHGHTYLLQVTLEGKRDKTGMLVDFNVLKEIITQQVIDTLDHKVLNDVLSFNTTAENMCVWIYNRLTVIYGEMYQNIKIKSIKLWETPTSSATYRGVED